MSAEHSFHVLYCRSCVDLLNAIERAAKTVLFMQAIEEGLVGMSVGGIRRVQAGMRHHRSDGRRRD